MLPLRTKRDLQDIFTLAGFSSLSQSLVLQSSYISSDSGDTEDFEDEDEPLLDGTDLLCDTLHSVGIGLLSMSALLEGDGTRGPYNTFRKCTSFFPLALSWPDAWFRHIFR